MSPELKLIREALGRTERQQAERLGLSGSTVHKSEQSQADERITLGQLRKLADGREGWAHPSAADHQGDLND